jgi:AcrR family transcriptional regulator
VSLWTKENVDRRLRAYLGEDDGSPQAKKRARILGAATRAFMARGYRRTSIDEIARDAGVAKGTVYLYYPSKAVLLTHAIALEKKALLARFEPLLTGAIPPARRLHAWLDIMLASATDLPLVARLMSGDRELLEALSELEPDTLARSRDEGRAWIAELIELAAPGVFTDAQKNARADVLNGVGYLAMLVLDERVRGGAPLEVFRTTLAEMLATGAATPRRDEPGASEDGTKEQAPRRPTRRRPR